MIETLTGVRAKRGIGQILAEKTGKILAGDKQRQRESELAAEREAAAELARLDTIAREEEAKSAAARSTSLANGGLHWNTATQRLRNEFTRERWAMEEFLLLVFHVESGRFPYLGSDNRVILPRLPMASQKRTRKTGGKPGRKSRRPYVYTKGVVARAWTEIMRHRAAKGEQVPVRITAGNRWVANIEHFDQVAALRWIRGVKPDEWVTVAGGIRQKDVARKRRHYR